LFNFCSSKSLAQPLKVVVHNGTTEQIQVSIGVDEGSTTQSNSWFKLESKCSDGWGRSANVEYMCFVFYQSICYGFVVVSGKSYSFIDGKLFDLEKEEYVIVKDLDEFNGYVSIRSLTDKIQVSLSGGNEGKIDVAKYETKEFQRNSGEYLILITSKGQEFKYLVSSGYSYYVYATHFIRTRNNEVLKENKDAVPITLEKKISNSSVVSVDLVKNNSDISNNSIVTNDFIKNDSMNVKFNTITTEMNTFGTTGNTNVTNFNKLEKKGSAYFKNTVINPTITTYTNYTTDINMTNNNFGMGTTINNNTGLSSMQTTSVTTNVIKNSTSFNSYSQYEYSSSSATTSYNNYDASFMLVSSGNPKTINNETVTTTSYK